MTYRRRVWSWISCANRLRFCVFEYFPSQPGKLIWDVIWPDMYSPGKTELYMACTGNIDHAMRPRMRLSTKSPKLKLSAASATLSIASDLI